jgi:hypothetical protein
MNKNTLLFIRDRSNTPIRHLLLMKQQEQVVVVKLLTASGVGFFLWATFSPQKNMLCNSLRY